MKKTTHVSAGAILAVVATVSIAAAWLSSAIPAHAGGIENLTSSDASSGLREALTQGATNAVGKLGRADGFFKSKKVKIPLPESMQKFEGTMRKFGMGKQADDLVLAMNRAAESAVPEAKALLHDAVRGMTIDDARSILSGGDQAATNFLRKSTGAARCQSGRMARSTEAGFTRSLPLETAWSDPGRIWRH